MLHVQHVPQPDQRLSGLHGQACLLPTTCACSMMFTASFPPGASRTVSQAAGRSWLHTHTQLQLSLREGYEAEPISCGQVWMSPHPPKRGSKAIGTCPMLHTGFHKAWTASGLHTQVISFLQVLHPSTAVPSHISHGPQCWQGMHLLGRVLCKLPAGK